MVKNLSVNAEDAGDAGSIPGLGRSPGGGHGNPLQYSCLENPMERETWWTTVHGVAKNWTRLKWHTHAFRNLQPLYFLSSNNYGKAESLLRKRNIPSTVYLLVYGYQPWTDSQSTHSFYLSVLDTGKVETVYGNGLLWAISPWLVWPLFWFIDWSGTVDIDGTWEVPLVLLFPLPFGWANYLFQPCLSAESAGSFW